MKPKQVRTIYDLAELAGVSAATVSRALAGKAVVNSETAERIRKLAQQHGFQPSPLARNLRTRKTGAIGVVIPLGHERAQHISDPFFMTIIGFLADELTERGFDLMLSRVIPDRDDWLEGIIKTARVDGLIIIGQSDQSAVLNAAAGHYLPMVAWGAFTQGQSHCSVGTDNFLGGQMAMRHLIERGCKRVAFLGNPRAIEIAQRLQGARAVQQDHAADVMLTEVPTHLAPELSAPDINAYLDQVDQLPDGIFAASDMIALAAVQTVISRGMSIPDDVRIVGFDDLPIAQSIVPPLTTIHQDIASGATQMVDCLLKRIEGRQTGSIILNPALVVRGST
ncbi:MULTISPECIES: LacI family DNA-binding transcriptional regulator [unclassified Sphingobium]|uniref:LacI family DNA-binding transcriptional regulator n=1 Tax=unclassified Sphingobium TaxID=2611147 RepID=UPI0022252481|nr:MULTISPECIES: LacI family DNA-binding transcriptional regulator [unclassified Sphingobium]MCW2365968.1 DNA-binding LacI/PurR family transcriptional regulator [Sphingobium sp. B7D2B]MCW2369924.1 DNA-binding LacI/PurR family transcriptional regulator [Sphingobium sp. B11D3D]MCW2381372.1 DNA-binding LacI/PurR family transcriptional regulator [Sphingobium sp. B2D3B]MCW2394967.1 DNA-binding LacI/PurR family transcriptional regulator [Sphingobium sp. B8D3B]MCW2398521.1 DNA-binding LacI/PurR famil